jgi:hypothetical protein
MKNVHEIVKLLKNSKLRNFSILITLFNLLAFYISKDIGYLVLGLTLGSIIGFFTSLNMGYFYREFLKLDDNKIKLCYYDIINEKIVVDLTKNCLRFTIINNMLANSITINFTNFYDSNGCEIYIPKRNMKHVFHYYEKNERKNKYFIDLYKENDIKSFIEDIFFIPRSTTFSDDLNDIKEILEILSNTQGQNGSDMS